MAHKTICFQCKEHSHYNKENNCYRCGTDMIVMSGSALRIPKKESSYWKELTEIYWLQRKKAESFGEKMTTLIGFGNNGNWHGCHYKKYMPMREKEKASLAAIKSSYQTV